jgi:uncharacterized protein (UPF0128 family)
MGKPNTESGFGRFSFHKFQEGKESHMMDIVVLIGTVAFFGIALAYVQGCESL